MREGEGVGGEGAGVGVREVEAARGRIAGVVWRTPLERSAWLSDLASTDVYLKLECWQRTRSFKVRGAVNAVARLGEAALARGLVTASAGNHGQAVALAAREAGGCATVFVPRDAPVTKRERIRRLGATLNEECATYDEAEAAAQAHADEQGAVFVHAFSDADVVAGQGTIGLEIVEDLPGVRAVIVPVGGGGLIAGVGAVMKAADERIRVIGAQSERTFAMHAAFHAGNVVDTVITPTLADGLAGCVDETSYHRARPLVEAIHLVEERAIAAAIRQHFRCDGVVVEGAGAVGAAAIETIPLDLSGPAVVVVSGGNIDAAVLASLLSCE